MPEYHLDLTTSEHLYPLNNHFTVVINDRFKVMFYKEVSLCKLTDTITKTLTDTIHLRFRCCFLKDNQITDEVIVTDEENNTIIRHGYCMCILFDRKKYTLKLSDTTLTMETDLLNQKVVFTKI